MVIPKQYPHDLYLLTQTPPHKDEEGNMIPGTDEYVSKGKCRFEVAKRNAFITGIDGSQIFYSATIFAPLPKLDIVAGSSVKVVINGMERKFDVKAVDPGSQMNNRLWV